MSTRDPRFDDYVLKIHAVLDKLDYFRLFGINSSASPAEVKRVFYAMAKRFHPDKNRDAPEAVRQAIYEIYKRINEGYRVLCDPEKHALYLKAMAAGHTRLEQDMRSALAPKKPVDTLKSKAAREMYEKAEESLTAGNLNQADLYIRVAYSKEPQNEAVLAFVHKVAKLKAEKKAR